MFKQHLPSCYCGQLSHSSFTPLPFLAIELLRLASAASPTKLIRIAVSHRAEKLCPTRKSLQGTDETIYAFERSKC
jgi:hypothetical protein